MIEQHSAKAPKKTRSLSDLLDEADDTFSEAIIHIVDFRFFLQKRMWCPTRE